MLGELYTVGAERPKFIHIHSYIYEKDKFTVGQVVTTKERNRRGTFQSITKKWREDDFENVRISSFKDLPSRYTCLFLSKNLQNAKYWADKIRSRTGKYQCVEVELLFGKYVCVDEQIYNIEHFCREDIIDEAYSYWSGDEVLDNPIITILFEGVFKVCQEIYL